MSGDCFVAYPSGAMRLSAVCDLFILFIYTIIEGDTFGLKAILPYGPLNIKHIKTIYIYTRGVSCLFEQI